MHGAVCGKVGHGSDLASQNVLAQQFAAVFVVVLVGHGDDLGTLFEGFEGGWNQLLICGRMGRVASAAYLARLFCEVYQTIAFRWGGRRGGTYFCNREEFGKF